MPYIPHTLKVANTGPNITDKFEADGKFELAWQGARPHFLVVYSSALNGSATDETFVGIQVKVENTVYTISAENPVGKGRRVRLRPYHIDLSMMPKPPHDKLRVEVSISSELPATKLEVGLDNIVMVEIVR